MTSETRPDRLTACIIAVLAFIGASLALYQVSRPGLLLGVSSDVSVYVGGAVRLVHGAVPYRDFVFVQPPGFVLLATPFAFLAELIGTRDALAVLRLCTPLLTAANVVLVGLLIRHRGRAATLTACTVMACFPAELYAIRGPQLEPVLDLFCLLGAVLVFDRDDFAGSRRLAAAGIAFGFAAAVKAPALIPIALVAILCALTVRRRSLRFLGGAIGGFAIPLLPFLLMAPAALWRDTVTTQLGRIPATGRAPLVARIGEMTGLAEFGAPNAVVVSVALVLAVFVIAAFAASRRRPTALEWFALSASVAVGAAQLGPAQYYPQYAAFMAPFVALLLGLSIGRATEALHHRDAAFAVTTVACAAVVAALVWHVRGESVPDVAQAVDAVLPPGACALSNSPVYLFTSDRFQANGPECTDITDPAGTTLALGTSSAEAVATWRGAFTHVDYVVTDTPIGNWQLPPDAHVPSYVSENFRLVRSDGLLIYVRHGFSEAG